MVLWLCAILSEHPVGPTSVGIAEMRTLLKDQRAR